MNFRDSIHSTQQQQLRSIFKHQREALGLTQRELANKMGVIYSLIGKIETGDRRLDVFEFMTYCYALHLDPNAVMQLLANAKTDKHSDS